MNVFTYPYKRKPKVRKREVIFGLIGAPIFTLLAANNNRGLIVNHALEFSPEGATAVYWAVAIISVMAPALALSDWYIFQSDSHCITLSVHEISVPTISRPRTNRLVPLSDVSSIAKEVGSSGPFLIISHAVGMISIYRDDLVDSNAFEELYQRLQTSVGRERCRNTR